MLEIFEFLARTPMTISLSLVGLALILAYFRLFELVGLQLPLVSGRGLFIGMFLVVSSITLKGMEVIWEEPPVPTVTPEEDVATPPPVEVVEKIATPAAQVEAEENSRPILLNEWPTLIYNPAQAPRVTFKSGAESDTLWVTLDAYDVRGFRLYILKGQTLTLTLPPAASVGVKNAQGEWLPLQPAGEGLWTVDIPQTGDYLVLLAGNDLSVSAIKFHIPALG